MRELEEKEAELRQQITLTQKEVKIAELDRQLAELRLGQQARTTTAVSHNAAGAASRPPPVQDANFTVQDLRRIAHLQQVADEQIHAQDTGLPASRTREAAGQPVVLQPSAREGKALKSGKDCKIIDKVLCPQQWPHSHLALQFVSKDIPYEGLSIAQFVAGYTAIVSELPRASEQRQHRLEHLQDLMYYSCSFPWKAVLDFHGAVLIEIERGRRQWGDSFRDLDTHLFHARNSNPTVSTTEAHSKISRDAGGRRPQWFCSKYQIGQCDDGRKEHFALVGSERRWVKHICATCWLQDREARNHPETNKDCPLYRDGTFRHTKDRPQRK